MELVTVIIPTYKGSNKLARAIHSVLLQTYNEIEILVVDDNLPESDERKATQAVIQKYFNDKVKYFKHDNNLNGAVARNTGIKNSKGEYITFLDDDDFMYPNRISDAVTFLKTHTVYEGVYCGVTILNGECIVSSLLPQHELLLENILFDDMSIGTGSNIFVRKTCFDKLKGFDERFIRNQDVEFMVRLLTVGRVAPIKHFGLVKGQNGTVNQPDYYKMVEVKKLFNQKYECIIKKFSDELQEKYYESVYAQLFYIAVRTDIKSAQKAKQELLKFRNLTMKEKISFECCKFNAFYKIFMMIKRYLGLFSKILLKKTVKYDATLYVLYRYGVDN